MTTGKYEFIRSYSRAGESQVIFMARDSMPSSDIPALWYQVRKKIGDIHQTLPEGVVGPFFNDEFGDTFGNIYALTGDGFDYAVLKDYADRIQIQLQRVKDVGKVDLLGLQDEKVWVELSNVKLATLGLPLAAVQQQRDTRQGEEDHAEPEAHEQEDEDHPRDHRRDAERQVDDRDKGALPPELVGGDEPGRVAPDGRARPRRRPRPGLPAPALPRAPH